MQFTIEFYVLEDGIEPAKEFMESLNAKMLAKVIRIIELLEEYGPNVRMPYSKYLEDGIFEIRAKEGTNIARVLYFFVAGRKIILTNGFIKKTQKTPKDEVEKAKKYRKDYERRTKNDKF